MLTRIFRFILLSSATRNVRGYFSARRRSVLSPVSSGVPLEATDTRRGLAEGMLSALFWLSRSPVFRSGEEVHVGEASSLFPVALGWSVENLWKLSKLAQR